MIILVESPYSGDIQRNCEYARRAMLYVIEQGHTPIVPHLLYPQVLDDSDPMQRERALEMCAELRDSADEVWFFVDYGFSPGMVRANEELNFTRTLVGAGSRKFKEVRAVTTEIGQNPEGPSYRKLPIEQQLELERQDRKGAHAQLERANNKLSNERDLRMQYAVEASKRDVLESVGLDSLEDALTVAQAYAVAIGDVRSVGEMVMFHSMSAKLLRATHDRFCLEERHMHEWVVDCSDALDELLIDALIEKRNREHLSEMMFGFAKARWCGL